MSATITAAPVSSEAIAANTELYRELALRWNRTRLTSDGEFNAADMFSDSRLMTEREAEAEAATMTENFERIVRARNENGFSAFLCLGCDLILDMPKAK